MTTATTTTVTRPALKPSRSKRVLKTLAPDSHMGEGDTELVLNICPDDLAADAFELLCKEVEWKTMSHRGGEVPRLVAVQGEVAPDGSYPVYRHPSDASPPLAPFTPTVQRIRAHVEQHLGQRVNHVLIQQYRNGQDYISEHSDKTLDIARGSSIVNVSFGAERLMILRTKRDAAGGARTPTQEGTPSPPPTYKGPPRAAQRIPLPHNSLFVLGPETNARWLHSIRQDKRPDGMKSAAERAHGGARISLTFRQIGTFLDKTEARIWGQGATAKTRESARPVVNGDERAAQEMINAFGEENQRAEFDWDATYGRGFDVLHLTSST